MTKCNKHPFFLSEKLAEATTPTRSEGFSLSKSQSPMGRSPNSLLVSNANRNHQNKPSNGPSASITKVRTKKSSESGNEEENVGGRIIYDDPQVRLKLKVISIL